ncbi:MAG: class I SAM-dependent methyltransferase [Dissulfurispiraceae bacterium]|jgi:SAM-dependent methyltransferase
MFNWLSELFGLSSSARKNLRNKFTDIYINNTFGGKESRSGEGSSFEQTAVIRQELVKLIEDLGVSIFLDAPCGDLYWIKETPLNVEKYIGIDIVEGLVEENKNKFRDDRFREFYCLNLVENILPRADLIFCRDCLVHLHYKDIKKVIFNLKKSQSTYLLTTTFTDRKKNIDLTGKNIWRPLNLQIAPFNFPPPLKLINERCTEANNQFTDKCLGLWRLEDIPDSRTGLGSKPR